MSGKLRKRLGAFRLSIAGKLRLAIGAIVAILLISSIISIFEFRRMSTYVSDQISETLSTMNLGAELAVAVDEYNLNVFSALGKIAQTAFTEVDTVAMSQTADMLFASLDKGTRFPLDSLRCAYDEYYRTSRQLDSAVTWPVGRKVEWFFTVLGPRHNNFRKHMDEFNVAVYDNLKTHSVSFDESFYRSITPSVVSVATAIVLCLLLLFFIVAYYIKPLRKMLKGLDAYKQSGRRYNTVFEGDDELQSLNGGIADVIDENLNLKNRLKNRES